MPRFGEIQYFQSYRMNMHVLTQLSIILQATDISGRSAALLPAGLGLISVIIGSFALRRSRSHVGKGRQGASIALCLGLISLILSVMHLIRTSDNSIGTGSGKLGAIVALVLALIGIILGGITLAHLRASNTADRK